MYQNEYITKLAKLKQLSVAIANGKDSRVFDIEAKMRGFNLYDILALDSWYGQGEARNISEKIIMHYNAHNFSEDKVEELRNQDKMGINHRYTNGKIKTLETVSYKPVRAEQKIFRLAKPKRTGFWGRIKETAYAFAGLFG